MEILSARDLRKRYGDVEVVRGIDLSVERGRCFGLLGPNGAGKTTTLRLCLGLIDPDAGEIRVLGEPVPRRAREARLRIGVVPQFDNLDPDFTVEENLRVWGRYFGLSRAEVDRRIPALLAFAGLEGRARTRLQTLSGGMRRRLTLARALVNDPDLLFLDEPTTGLDPQARHLIWERLKRLIAAGKTIVLTTHFMDEAERLCDVLSIMDYGEIIAHGAPRRLIRDTIPQEVVEVYGEGVAAWAAEHGQRLAERCELAGDTAFCYTANARPLIDDLDAREGLRYLHRPANLEDVFLKLTGRDIRD